MLAHGSGVAAGGAPPPYGPVSQAVRPVCSQGEHVGWNDTRFSTSTVAVACLYVLGSPTTLLACRAWPPNVTPARSRGSGSRATGGRRVSSACTGGLALVFHKCACVSNSAVLCCISCDTTHDLLPSPYLLPCSGAAKHDVPAAAATRRLVSTALPKASCTVKWSCTGVQCDSRLDNCKTHGSCIATASFVSQAVAFPRPLAMPRPTAFPGAPHMVPQPRVASSAGLAGGPPVPPRPHASAAVHGTQPGEARPAHLHAVLPNTGPVGTVNSSGLLGLLPSAPSDRPGPPRLGALAGVALCWASVQRMWFTMGCLPVCMLHPDKSSLPCRALLQPSFALQRNRTRLHGLSRPR